MRYPKEGTTMEALGSGRANRGLQVESSRVYSESIGLGSRSWRTLV